MALTRWDPFREMMSLREAVNRMFDESLTPWRRAVWGEGVMSVPIDMYETDDEVVVTAELPGIKPEDVDIRVTGNTLSIKGEIKQEQEETRGSVHYRERRYGSFERSIVLPANVDTEKVDATFESGILRITAAKTEEARPRRIEVKTGGKQIEAGKAK